MTSEQWGNFKSFDSFQSSAAVTQKAAPLSICAANALVSIITTMSQSMRIILSCHRSRIQPHQTGARPPHWTGARPLKFLKI